MKFKELSNANLHFHVQNLVRNERKVTAQILESLAEIEKRKVFLERGYESMFSYCVKELKYSEGAASRRLQAMRLFKSNNQVKEKIENGELTLSQASMIQTVIRAEGNLNAQKMNCSSELLTEVLSKTQKETQKVLQKHFSLESMQALEKQLAVKDAGDSTIIEIKLSKVEFELFEKVHSLRSAQQRNFKDTILWLCEQHLKKSKFNSSDPESPMATAKQGRAHLPMQLQRNVFQRAQYQCEHKSPLTGKRCEQKKFLEIDHIQPLAYGGNNDLQNLRALCREHNQMMARQKGLRTQTPGASAKDANQYH